MLFTTLLARAIQLYRNEEKIWVKNNNQMRAFTGICYTKTYAERIFNLKKPPTQRSLIRKFTNKPVCYVTGICRFMGFAGSAVTATVIIARSFYYNSTL